MILLLFPGTLGVTRLEPGQDRKVAALRDTITF
jgi:hypothetical protein